MIVQISKWAAIATIVGGIPVGIAVIASPFNIIKQVEANTTAIKTIEGKMDKNHSAVMRHLKEMRITTLQEHIRTLEVSGDLSENEKYRLRSYKDDIEQLKRDLERL